MNSNRAAKLDITYTSANVLGDPTDDFVHGLKSLFQRKSADCTAQANFAEIPEVIGEYRLLRKVGRGGMGVVFEAVQTHTKQRVALKILPLPSLLDPNASKRFLNGARAAAALEHPHIVKVLLKM